MKAKEIPITRLMRFVTVNPDSGCWEWGGYIGPCGYGSFWHKGRMRGAHRVAFELIKGDVPKGFQIDHLCRNTKCANPEHLEAVTQRENMRRIPADVVARRVRASKAAREAKTHCPRGHLYSGDNLRIYRPKSGGERRHCRACHREYTLQQHYEKKTSRYKKRKQENV